MITLHPDKFYVYKHLIPNTSKIFYIGVGSYSRPFECRSDKRNTNWVIQFNKTGVTVDIISEHEDIKEAFDHEIIEIARAKRDGHPLVNETNGGKGHLGRPPWNKGKTNVFSKSALEKISKASKEAYFTLENRIKHSKACGGGKAFKAIDDVTDEVVWAGFIQAECARFLKLGQGTISKCLNGYQKTYKGYRFEYVKEK